VLLSILMSVAVLLPFVALVPACPHWFIGPVLVCGILIGIDFVDWLRGRMNLFDPVGILGVLGFHAFFLFQYGTSVGLVLLFTCRPVRSILQLPGSL
jgi:hypothetical protein